jgi:hypothetical protein
LDLYGLQNPLLKKRASNPQCQPRLQNQEKRGRSSSTTPSASDAMGIKLARKNLLNPFMEPTPVIVAIGTLLISKPIRKLKVQEFILNPSPAIDAIKKKGQNIMRVPILSMTFNAKTAIKISTR